MNENEGRISLRQRYEDAKKHVSPKRLKYIQLQIVRMFCVFELSEKVLKKLIEKKSEIETEIKIWNCVYWFYHGNQKEGNK